MNSNVSTTLSTAPVTWGVWEATIERDDLVPPDRLLDAMRGCGYSRLELGPPGYFGSDPESAARRIRAAGMTLAGAFVPLHLADEARVERDLEELDATIATLAHFAEDDPMVILADAGSPARVRAAGKPVELQATALSADALGPAAERITAAAQECRSRDLTPSFHHHAESYFESPDEVTALLGELDPALLGLCFDTGHALIGGGDPVELMQAWAPWITHVHLKDVDPPLLDELRRGATTLHEAWARGLFCPLGQGAVDFPRLFELPAIHAFQGITVIEQDRIAVTERELPDVAEVEAENLAYITTIAEQAGIALRR